MKTTAAASVATSELATNPLAELVGLGEAGLDPAGEVLVAEDAEPDPVAEPTGVPVRTVTPLGMGPTEADADAPIPTSPPWPCYKAYIHD